MVKSNIAFLFPGQGSQYPGIGKDLYDAHQIVRETFEEASEVLNYDIGRLCFADSNGRIHQTQYTQPVLLTHSTACCRVFSQLAEDNIRPGIVAGHSLGEYSALVCAGALTFSLALKLVKARGELMGKYGEGEMEALTVDLETAAVLAENHYCGIAACNLPNQTVVGGHPDDLDALVADMVEQFPRSQSSRLKTEGAFHTYYMVEAARRFRQVLEDSEFIMPSIQVLSNYTGGAHDSSADSIRSRLFLQLFNPVLWHQNLLALRESAVSIIVEFGGGLGKGSTPAEKRPNLESLVKKTFRGNPMTYLSVINLGTLDQAVAYFQD